MIKTKTRKQKMIENEKIENENGKTAKTCHSTKVLAYNMALTGATAVQR